MTSWRDDLVVSLAATMDIVAAKGARCHFSVLLTWKGHNIDLPEVCNHFTRRFKVDTVEYKRKPNSGLNYAAILTLYDVSASKLDTLSEVFKSDKQSVALSIVRSGT